MFEAGWNWYINSCDIISVDIYFVATLTTEFIEISSGNRIEKVNDFLCRW